MLGNLKILDLLISNSKNDSTNLVENTISSCYHAVCHRDFVALLMEKLVKEREED
jgi:hypothetical protein